MGSCCSSCASGGGCSGGLGAFDFRREVVQGVQLRGVMLLAAGVALLNLWSRKRYAR